MKIFLPVCVFVFLLFSPAHAVDQLTPLQTLGQFLFFDKNLSEPDGQSCASCHEPSMGFVDPDSDLPVSEGVKPGLFGHRNAPSSAYAMYAPPLHYDAAEGVWIGGQFWGGRARGYELGDPLADQAMGPFLNPVEMANPDKASVIRDIRKSAYAGLFEQQWGAGSLDDVERAYEQAALALAAFQRSAVFARFDSKYDGYLQACLAEGGDANECAQGKGMIAERVASRVFTPAEHWGMLLFMAENNNDGVFDMGEGAFCSACHVAEWTDADSNVVVPDWAPAGKVPPLFTDFTFDNLGLPANPDYRPADASRDLGIGAIVKDSNENGKFKVMTLRNIGLTAPYGHNGVFRNLIDFVHFYNTRDEAGALADGSDWPVAEVPATVNTEELGRLGLSEVDEAALVEFMNTLSDGYPR